MRSSYATYGAVNFLWQVYMNEPKNRKSVLSPSKDEIDLMQVFRTLWHGKLWILLSAITAVTIGGVYVYFIAVPIYRANAVVVLDGRQEQVVDITSVMTGLSGDQASINTEVEVLRSRGLISKLARRLDLLNDLEFNPIFESESDHFLDTGLKILRGLTRVNKGTDLGIAESKQAALDAVIDRLLKKLTISNVRQSYVFNITMSSTDPMKSANIANALAELYILDQLEVKFEATTQATTWLTERVTQLQAELEIAEATVKDFVSSTDLINPESLAALNRKLKELRERLDKAELDREAKKQILDALVEAASTNNASEIANVAQDQELARLFALISNSDSIDHTAIDARIGQLIESAEAEKSRLTNQIDALKRSVSDLQERIENQSDDLVKLRQLQREADASRLIYEYFLGRLKETSVQQGIQQADSRILSRAVVPQSASSPRIPIILVLSGLLGVVIGSSLVLLRELSQNTFRTAEDLERRTGYPVLGQIPAIQARKRKNILQYLINKPTSSATEAIRNLRTSILLSSVDGPPKVIMSTSSITGEGKTIQSITLAQNLSALGKKVLLIEGDIRRRVFAEYFDVEGKKGLLAVLEGNVQLQEAVLIDERLNADILIGEETPINATDVFSSKKFSSFLTEMRAHYDYIIIDTPPVLAVPDARVIGQLADSILYTVKWDSTLRWQVLEGLKSFEQVGVKISGFVLAQINTRGMKRYGYGNSYGVHNGYHDD